MSSVHRGGSGSPLLLLHGALATWRIWQPTLSALETEHEVFAPTLPGHLGASEWGRGEPLTITTLTDAVERQLDRAGIESPHIAGNSLGGWIALELARRNRARSVIAMSPAGAWATRADLIRLRRRVKTGAFVLKAAGPRAELLLANRHVRRLVLTTLTPNGHRLKRAEVHRIVEEAIGCSVLDELLSGTAGQLGAGLDRATMPIVIAWGDRDRLLPFGRHGKPMLDLVPAAEYVRLPGVGHTPMLDDPALVTDTILAVTRRVDDGVSGPAQAPRRSPRASSQRTARTR